MNKHNTVQYTKWFCFLVYQAKHTSANNNTSLGLVTSM